MKIELPSKDKRHHNLTRKSRDRREWIYVKGDKTHTFYAFRHFIGSLSDELLLEKKFAQIMSRKF